MAGIASRQNGLKGGRKKGTLNSSTLDKIKVEKEVRQRVLKAVDNLINSQMCLAKGVNLLYRIEQEVDKKGNTHRSKPILVTNQSEVESYLAGEFDDSEDYYFITTEKPNNQALDSLLDRTFGKARQNIGLDGGEDGKAIEFSLTTLLEDDK